MTRKCATALSVPFCAAMLGALLSSAPTASAAEPDEATVVAKIKRLVKKDSDGFFAVKYGGYIVKSDVDEQFTAEAAEYLREFYEAFRSFFLPKPKLKATPVVYLFKDRKTFQDYTRKLGYDKFENAGGFYAGGDGRSELFCWHSRPGKGFAEFPTHVIRHEGAHQLLAYVLGTHRIPIWYNEGVATFFEGWEVEKPREWNLANLAKTHTRLAAIARTYGTKEFCNLHDLMDLDDKTWMPDDFGPKTTQHYAEVESFMTFLLASEKGRRFAAEVFRVIEGGKDPAKALSWQVIDNAQKAWYKDIEERIENLKKAQDATKKE